MISCDIDTEFINTPGYIYFGKLNIFLSCAAMKYANGEMPCIPPKLILKHSIFLLILIEAGFYFWTPCYSKLMERTYANQILYLHVQYVINKIPVMNEMPTLSIVCDMPEWEIFIFFNLLVPFLETLVITGDCNKLFIKVIPRLLIVHDEYLVVFLVTSHQFVTL